MDTGILYLISTPIGNMEDITLRAIKMIGSVDLLLCEDTRHTGLLIQWIENKISIGELRISTYSEDSVNKANYEFKKPKLLSYQEFNEQRRIPEVIDYLKQGLKIGLVSNAGTPTISDPGFKLVRETIKEGIKVEAIPGASALLTALVTSGLPTNTFTFLGYLPKKQGKRRKFLENNILNKNKMTYICYESPYRLLDSLQDIKETIGDIDIIICRELTKIHEEIFRGNVEDGVKYFSDKTIKGEITLLFQLNNQ